MKKYMLSQEIKQKISNSHKTSPLAILARKKLHLSQIGRSRDEKTRKIMEQTQFKKGQIPWNKGLKNTLIPWNKGKRGHHIHTEEFKAKLSLRMKGHNNTAGKEVSLQTRLKLSKAHKGEKHYNWKGGITSKNAIIRRSLKIRLWREAVFKRDKFICRHCKNEKCFLNAHHIKPFAYFPELRFVVDNGITLCVACHRKIHVKK